MYKIREVSSRRDLRRFIGFPDRLYKNCPQYVPALHSNEVKNLTRLSTLSYCERKMWLLEDDGKVIGRICGMINPRYNERYSAKRARFGWFDVINDRKAAGMLLETAEAWARAQGMDEIHGPLFYNTLGKQGMLVEGFENIPPFNCLYNYPYYQELVESFGYSKECDWIQYELKTYQMLPPKTERIADMVTQRYGLQFGSIDKLKKDAAQVRNFFDVYNRSFAEAVLNFIPFTDEEIEEEAAATIPYLSDKTSTIVMDKDGKLAGFGIAFPSISKALQKARGHMFPFGWIHLLRALKNYDTMDLMINGATPEWQGKGVSAVYYRDIYRKLNEVKGRTVVTNPQIETNSAVNIWNCWETKPFMRRRCYIKHL
ncbi:MAG: GNAT family N-acetyltransferase [Bacteroidaceae bacterium]|nr:GNAT family N-acetyltransferase [Bacteroidaceae bacterium]